jgi:putative membrane protein
MKITGFTKKIHKIIIISRNSKYNDGVDTIPFGMMGDYGYGYGMMGGYGGMFFGLLFFIIIIVLGYFLIKSLITHSANQGVAGKSALDIAKERYAKGEITKEELEEMKKNL